MRPKPCFSWALRKNSLRKRMTPRNGIVASSVSLPIRLRQAKAAGAIVRFESVGKTISLSGKSPSGEKVQLADYRGKVVLIHYWATWSNSSKKDLPVLKRLATTYGPKFMVLGVSLDNKVKDLNDYLAENELPWPQIFEEGGMDSPPANQLGVLTVPAMILVNQDGQVVNRAISPNDIEAEVKKLLR